MKKIKIKYLLGLKYSSNCNIIFNSIFHNIIIFLLTKEYILGKVLR